MYTGLYVRLAQSLGMRRGLAATLGVAGALAALYPSAFLGDTELMGPLGGLTYGLAGGLAAGVVAMPMFVATVVCLDDETGVGRELHLAEVALGSRIRAALVASLAVAVRQLVYAPLTGAVVGLAAGIAYSQQLGGMPRAQTLLALTGVLVYLTAFTAAIAILTRRAVLTLLLVHGLFLVFLATLPITGDDSAARWFLSATPQGVLWSVVYRSPDSRFSSTLSSMTAGYLMAGYVLAFAAVALLRVSGWWRRGGSRPVETELGTS